MGIYIRGNSWGSEYGEFSLMGMGMEVNRLSVVIVGMETRIGIMPPAPIISLYILFCKQVAVRLKLS